MKEVPKFNVSGLRGVYPESLSVVIAAGYARAFGLFVKSRGGRKILLGRDTRPSGAALVGAVSVTLTGLGLEITDGGVLPTPAVPWLVKNLGFDGAVIVTASHNPAEYNGLKFVNGEGFFLDEREIEEVKYHA